MDKICCNCKKKLGILFYYRCGNHFFCMDCLSGVHNYITKNLDVLYPELVQDIILLSKEKDDLYKNNFLEKVLKEREDCEKWKKADQADLKEIDREYQQDCRELKKELERDLREAEKEQKEYIRSQHNRISIHQKRVMEEVKQGIIDNYEKDLAFVKDNYELDKKGINEIIRKGNEKKEKNDMELEYAIQRIRYRADEVRKELERARKAEEARAMEKKIQEEKLHCEEKINEEVVKPEKIAIDKKVKEKEAKQENIQEVEKGGEIKKNSEYLAWISLVTSVLAWLTMVTGILPLIFLPISLVTGIKGLKTTKRNLAIAGIVISSIPILLVIIMLV